MFPTVAFWVDRDRKTAGRCPSILLAPKASRILLLSRYSFAHWRFVARSIHSSQSYFRLLRIHVEAVLKLISSYYLRDFPGIFNVPLPVCAHLSNVHLVLYLMVPSRKFPNLQPITAPHGLYRNGYISPTPYQGTCVGFTSNDGTGFARLAIVWALRLNFRYPRMNAIESTMYIYNTFYPNGFVKGLTKYFSVVTWI